MATLDDVDLRPEVGCSFPSYNVLRTLVQNASGPLQAAAGLADASYTGSGIVQNDSIAGTNSWPVPQTSTYPSTRKIIKYA
jgi:hypothetical protein